METINCGIFKPSDLKRDLDRDNLMNLLNRLKNENFAKEFRYEIYHFQTKIKAIFVRNDNKISKEIHIWIYQLSDPELINFLRLKSEDIDESGIFNDQLNI